MRSDVRRHQHERASASAAALAATILIATLLTGVMRMQVTVAGVVHRLPWTPDAVSRLTDATDTAVEALEDNPYARVTDLERATASVLRVRISAENGVLPAPRIEIADLSSTAILAQTLEDPVPWSPLHPVIHSMDNIREVYAKRTGSAVRADQFVRDLQRRISTGAPLSEQDIRIAAGIDYALIRGIVTGEPLVNVNAAPAARLLDLCAQAAPNSSPIQAGVEDAVRALIGLRNDRAVTAAEVAAAIDGVVARAGESLPINGRQRLVQQLSALLGVRTWVWELTLDEGRWIGRALIAWPPGYRRPVILGLAVQER